VKTVHYSGRTPDTLLGMALKTLGLSWWERRQVLWRLKRADLSWGHPGAYWTLSLRTQELTVSRPTSTMSLLVVLKTTGPPLLWRYVVATRGSGTKLNYVSPVRSSLLATPQRSRFSTPRKA
jgi:hypothetical protein